MTQLSIKFPLRETAQVTSIKFPIRETAFILQGFIIEERVIDWQIASFNILESIKSRIFFDTELIDKNHIKITWYGEPVPKILIYRKAEGEEDYGSPFVTLPWTPQEYEMLIDGSGYDIKLMGIQDTGESSQISLGENQDNNLKVDVKLPVNEKYYYIDCECTSEYRIEVNL